MASEIAPIASAPMPSEFASLPNAMPYCWAAEASMPIEIASSPAASDLSPRAMLPMKLEFASFPMAIADCALASLDVPIEIARAAVASAEVPMAVEYWAALTVL